MVKMKNYAALVALSQAEREPIRHTVHGYSVCTFDGKDWWAYTPAGVAPQPEAAA